VSWLVVVLALAGPPAAPEPSPGASPTDTSGDRLRLVKERRTALERELAALRGQEHTLLGDVERLEVEVRVRGEQLREAQITLQRTNEQMDETLRRTRLLEAQIARARPVLAARARALYELGDLSYVRLLLSVEHPSDMLRGYRFVTTLARRDRERIAQFRKDLDALQTARGDLQQRTEEAQRQRAEMEAARRQMDADRRRKTALLTRIVEQKETQAAYVEELQEAEGRLTQLVQGLSEAEVAVPIGVFRGTLPWPVPGKMTTGFGRHKHPRFDTYTVQNGIEIEAREGTPVHAIHEGTVVFADRFQGYGLMVVVDHGGKHHSLYAHLSDVQVRTGQRLATGDVVGLSGSSGLEGTGLYFEMRFQGRPEDPGDWLQKR
jgi:septal ring factor EnvC (AmiA/AmiB activator)